MDPEFHESDFMSCCGSTKFAKGMVEAAPFANCDVAIDAARDIWMNRVDVNGWLEAFAAHPQIGVPSSATRKSEISAQWSKGEQSTALATATDSALQELHVWNIRYKQKFGFIFIICASGRSTPEILHELKKRYQNRPIVEFDSAAQEQMKITELRLVKLFATKATTSPITSPDPVGVTGKPREDRVSVIGGHLAATVEAPLTHVPDVNLIAPAVSGRTRPPITTHVLDVSRGSPASGIEVHLEMWKRGNPQRPSFNTKDSGEWIYYGQSVTNSDGRCGALMDTVDNVAPGFYRISFNTRKYLPNGFFPYVSIVFEIKESQGDFPSHDRWSSKSGFYSQVATWIDGHPKRLLTKKAFNQSLENTNLSFFLKVIDINKT